MASLPLGSNEPEEESWPRRHRKTQAVIEEVRKTRDTAARLANGEATDDADHVRVLAGMIQKLAEQVGRLAGDDQGASPASAGGDSQVDEAPIEEDRTPQDAPADPADSAAEERP